MISISTRSTFFRAATIFLARAEGFPEVSTDSEIIATNMLSTSLCHSLPSLLTTRSAYLSPRRYRSPRRCVMERPRPRSSFLCNWQPRTRPSGGTCFDPVLRWCPAPRLHVSTCFDGERTASQTRRRHVARYQHERHGIKSYRCTYDDPGVGFGSLGSSTPGPPASKRHAASCTYGGTNLRGSIDSGGG